MASIYDLYDSTPAGTNAYGASERDPVPPEGFYPKCVIHECSEFVVDDWKQFYKIRYEVLEGPETGRFFTQIKTLKGCADELPTPLDQAPKFKFKKEPGSLSLGEKAVAEFKQAIGAAFGMTVEQSNDPVTGVKGSRLRDAASEAQPCRGLCVAMKISYERYVKKDHPKKGQLKGEPGKPFAVFAALPIAKDGSLTEHALPAYVPSFQKKEKAESAPAAPPPPPAAPSLAKVLPEGWKVNPNAPEYAFFAADHSVPQRKVSSF